MLAAQRGSGAPVPPNIVVLFADDAGWADFGFQPDCDPEAARLTPRIDSIARAGVRFDAAYMTGCVCSPSRAGLMCGRYQQRFGHEMNLPPGYMKGGMDLDERTIADHLGRLGYATALVGKWHLGYPEPYQPNQRGFDWFYGLLQGSRSYRPLERATPHRVIQENGRALPEQGYVTDRFADAAVRFIEERRAKPFFLFVSFTATHSPLQPTDEDLARVPEIAAKKRRKNLGLLVGLDRAVGKVLDALDENGLTERTLVVFTNDNGGQTQSGARNGPLRGRKGLLFEGGVRVPMAMRWPGHIQPGLVIDAPVISLDLLPTFLAAAGAQAPKDAHLDGESLLALIEGHDAAFAERSLFWRSLGPDGPVAIRAGKWKLVHRRGKSDPGPFLFDLETDLSETHDLAAEHPELVAELSQRIAAWESELEEPRWGPNKR